MGGPPTNEDKEPGSALKHIADVRRAGADFAFVQEAAMVELSPTVRPNICSGESPIIIGTAQDLQSLLVSW
jgi:hypothetical protein